MNLNYSTRIKVGITALVLCALFSSMRLLYRQIDLFSFQTIGQDFTSVKVKRFETIKDSLPPHGVVGFTSNVAADSMFYFNDKMAGYFSAQYTLAPLVIAYTPEKEIVIGNFIKTRRISKTLKDNGLVVSKSFDDFLLLLRRETK